MSDLAGNPEDRSSHNEAHFKYSSITELHLSPFAIRATMLKEVRISDQFYISDSVDAMVSLYNVYL